MKHGPSSNKSYLILVLFAAGALQLSFVIKYMSSNVGVVSPLFALEPTPAPPLKFQTTSKNSKEIEPTSQHEKIIQPAGMQLEPSQSTRDLSFYYDDDSPKQLSPPTKVVIVGERASGVSYVAEVLEKAFDSSNDSNTIVHRQIIRTDLLDENELDDIRKRIDVLWVMVVRSPCEWADAMIRLEQEFCSQKSISKEHRNICSSFKETENDQPGGFYETPWYDWYGDSEESYPSDASIVSSDAVQTVKYNNIFHLRQQKLRLMQQIMTLHPRHVKIVRLNEFERNPDVLVRDLEKEYLFVPNENYEQHPPSTNIHRTLCMDHDLWEKAQQNIDWEIEGYFGYQFLDCHLCRTTDSNVGGTNENRESMKKISDTDLFISDGGQSLSKNILHSKKPLLPPSKIYLLGERNSGTTFVSSTLAKAFEIPNSYQSDADRFASDIPVLLHKHMFRHDLLNSTELDEVRERTDILWILVVRTPCDWAEGMYRKPYHMCPPKHVEEYCGPKSNSTKTIWLNQNSVVGLSLSDFFGIEWSDWPESTEFMRKRSKKNGPQFSISKVSQNFTYSNIFGLRRHKLQIMKQIVEAAPWNVKIVRLKEVERAPEIFIQDLLKEFNLPLKEDYEVQSASKLTHSTVCLTQKEWALAQNFIDWELEGLFGFSPFDCRMCYGYRSKRLAARLNEMKENKKVLQDED